jgi:allophanate hydrolase
MMADPRPADRLDLTSLALLFQDRNVDASAVLSDVLDRVEAYADPAVWIHRLPRRAVLQQAEVATKRRARGEPMPFYGVPFAVKDSIDVAGYPTTCACPAYSRLPDQTAPVVQRLLDAGAILIGKTNLDQFGVGLAGDRTPYGCCANPFDPAYISGGSSSGSAVSVATGMVSFALGTDTAGSGRVPAGCNNVVGLKPTRGSLSTDGVVPACRSLDCVSVFALTADDARTVWSAARERFGPADADTPWWDGGFTFATPRDEDLEFFGDAGQADLYRQAIAHLKEIGGRRKPIDFAPFREVAALLYDGPWLAERLAELEGFLRANADAVHPVTRGLIEGGRRYSAVDYFAASHRLAELSQRCMASFEAAEILVVPTLPALPTRAAVQADSVGWGRRLGTYTNFVNLLGLAALAVPAGFTPAGLPGGITLIGPGNSEGRLCGLGMAWQRHLDLPLGATGKRLPPRPSAPSGKHPIDSPTEKQVRLAVAGAHLRGLPLHPALKEAGARLVRTCRTASRYRFVALLDKFPHRPGLVWDEDRAGSAEVEVYDLPVAGFGALVASVAPPLAIGTVLLADGEMVKGFLCESWAADRALDITDFGGWHAFRAHARRAEAGMERQ